MSTGKKLFTYYECVGEEKVWSGYTGGPEPESIPGSTLEIP
jgi:hypothetical protein